NGASKSRARSESSSGVSGLDAASRPTRLLRSPSLAACAALVLFCSPSLAACAAPIVRRRSLSLHFGGGLGGKPHRINARQGFAGRLAHPGVAVALRRLEHADGVLGLFAKIAKADGRAPADVAIVVPEGFHQRRHDLG